MCVNSDIDALNRKEAMKTKYICKNCGHDIPCIIEVVRIEDDNINEVIKCEYVSRFKEVKENGN